MNITGINIKGGKTVKNYKGILFIGIACLILGLAQNALSQENVTDSIKIIKISPKEGTVLKKGSTVTFKIMVHYVLASAETGNVAVNVQDENNHLLKSSMRDIEKGAGTEELTVKVSIPSNIDSVLIYTPLITSGSIATSVVRVKTYPVQ